MKSIRFSRLFSGGLAAALCIVSSAAGAGAQTPPPVITEAFADAENATLTFNGAGFREGFPVVFLGNYELPVRWAAGASAAVWLPDLRPGTYRLIARWLDGSQADFYLTLGAAGPAGPAGSREPEGPRGLPGPVVAAHFGDPSAAGEAEGTAADTAPADPVGTTRYGVDALRDLTAGIRNTAFGLGGLSNVTTGGSNTAVGYLAMGGQYFQTGSGNTVVGSTALQHGTGSSNVAVGVRALRYSRGSFNIAVGASAGVSNPAGSDNIYIGHRGVAGESGIIRIGAAGRRTETHLTGTVYLPQAVFVGTPPTSLQGLLADMQGDVADIRGDVAGIRQDVAGLEGRVAGLENPALPAAGRLPR